MAVFPEAAPFIGAGMGLLGSTGALGGGDQQQQGGGGGGYGGGQPQSPLMMLAQQIGPAAAMNLISKQQNAQDQTRIDTTFNTNKNATSDAIKQYQGFLGQYQDPTQSQNASPYLQDPRMLATMSAPHIGDIGRGMRSPGLEGGGMGGGWSPFGGASRMFGGMGGGGSMWSPALNAAPASAAPTAASSPFPSMLAKRPPPENSGLFPPDMNGNGPAMNRFS